MKVRFIGESNPVMLTNGKVYDVLSVEKGWYRILDEEGTEDYYPGQPLGYLYSPDLFEIVSS